MAKELNMDFKCEVVGEGSDKGELLLIGYFDEFASLPDGVNFSNFKEFVIDFEKVDFINSGGIKLWINFVESMEQHPNMQVIFRNCRRLIIDQLNIIEGFLPKNAQVESLYLPMYCESCEKSFDFFQKVENLDNDIDSLANQTGHQCPKGDPKVELDINPEQFFRFRDQK